MSDTHSKLTVEELKEIVHYEPASGIFTRIKSVSPNARVGDTPGSIDRDGYLQMRIGKFTYPLHRLAWLYIHGAHPVDCIDHINCIKTDNRICNLREATRLQNNKNLPIGPKNNSGHKGVGWRKDTGKWRAQCRVNGRNFNIGSFDSLEDAAEAYVNFAKAGHGEFFRA